MLDSLADLPFATQRAWLDQRLAAGDDPGALLAAVAPLPDHGPLAHLLTRLVERGSLATPPVQDALAALVRDGAETAVQVALRALPAGVPPALLDRIAATLASLPLARINVTALGLRWLRDTDPARHRRLRDEAVQRCVAALESGMDAPDSDLLLAPGPALAVLPPALRDQARQARERLAPRLLVAIGAAPRSVAQVNAEELLARRVYERSGHFLFELLQNADDARASRLALSLAADELTLRHDGTPFDPLDVLGVLSIGLSTKDASSIGMFGVGFRSVYAVTERPQIHSGPFRFEISGMARPRPLAPRPDVADGETLIALPLDRPGAHADPIADEAAALPAEVLLTLRHLRRLDLSGPALTARDLSLDLAGDTARLTEAISGSSIQYRLARHDQALVLWQVDGDGSPLPRPPHAPSLYCFLPTREDTGLPVLIHAPFVVPVDRERLRHEDPRNQALLADASRALAALVASLDRVHTPAALALLAASRPAPSFAPVLDTTRRQLASSPLLTDASGHPVTAHEARLLPGALAAALAGVPLDPAGRRALAADTSGLVARWLGVEEFTARDLLSLLEPHLGAVREGDPPPVAWLGSTLALARSLASLTDPGDLRRREALPWVLVDGGCWRAASVRLATDAQRALYDGARPLLDLGDNGQARELAAAGLRWLTDREIVDDLRDPARRASLLRRDDALLTTLAQLSPALLAGLGSLPLFASTGGGFAPLVGDGSVFASVSPELGLDLADLGGEAPMRVRPEVASRHEALLRTLGGRALGWSELLAWWRAHARPATMHPVHALLRAADRTWRRWSPALLDELLSTRLFVDQLGLLRPLRGPDAALLPADDEITALLPWEPWLEGSEPQRSLTLLDAGGLHRQGAVDLVAALLGEGSLANGRLVATIDARALAAYLAPRASSLPAALLDRLAKAPLWADTTGQLGELARLRGPAVDEAVERLWALTSARPSIAPDSLALATALGLAARLAAGDLATLLADAQAGRIDLAPHRAALADVLRACPAASDELRGVLSALPLWRASDGDLRPASALVLGADLDALLGDPEAASLVGEPGARLAVAEQVEALGLRAFFAFRPAIELLDREVARRARPGRPLAEQPAWMASLDRLARLGAIARLHERRDWPVALTAAGVVTAHLPWSATDDERLLAALTPLGANLADPAWASRQDALSLPPLPVWKLLEALASELSERTPAIESELTPVHREALHRWLLRQAAVIEAHPVAPSLLGRLHGFLAVDGTLRAPPELLLVSGFGDLDLPGTPDPSLPGPLREWLGRLFRLDEANVAALFTALIEGAASAAEVDDHARLERTLLALARLVDTLARDPAQADRLERALRVSKAARRLRFPASDGSLRRARDLRLESDEQDERLLAFHREPPPRFDGPDDVRALAARLGASSVLTADELRAMLTPTGRRPGLDASVALAAYVAQAATETPSLRDALDLDRRAWVPAVDGSLRRPSELFWPAPGLAPLIGPRPDRVVHARLVESAPDTLARWLRFRTPADITVAEVAQGLRDHTSDPDAAWSWLDEALRDGRASNLRSHGLSLDQLATPDRFPRLVRELTAPARSPAAPARARSSPRSPAPAPAPLSPVPAPAEPAPRRSLWSRLFGRDESAPVPSAEATPRPDTAPPAPPGRPTRDERAPAPTDANWFQQRDQLNPQLGHTSGWLASRQQASRHGFSLSPRSLPVPYLYAPSLIGTRFERSTQSWQSGETKAIWLRPAPGTSASVSFEGSLGTGQVVLPCPLFATVDEAWLDDEPLTLRTTSSGLTTAVIPRAGAVRFTATLRTAPRFTDAALDDAPRSLLAPTTPDAELPAAVLAFVAAERGSGASPLSRALHVRDFVLSRYRYDLSYLTDERLARTLERATAGSAHRHLAALHVGCDENSLGAGVCYELNTLVCELLRRVGVPAGLSTGWVLDEGHIDEPDHLWAMALVPSDQGPRWMPLDASTGPGGSPRVFPRRPAPGQPAASDRRAPLPPEPAWARSSSAHAPGPASPVSPPVDELLRAARYLARQQGDPLDEQALQVHVRRLLDDPAQARRLLALLRGR